MRIEVRIAAVPKEDRMGNVRKLQSELGLSDESVFIDYEYKGPLENFTKLYTAPTDATHIIQLEDDVTVCDGFLEVVDRIVRARPDDIIALFDYYGIKEFDTPYVKVRNRLFTSPGLIVPKKYVDRIFSFQPSVLYRTNAGDAHMVSAAMKFGLPVTLVVPNIVDTLDFPSTRGHPVAKSKTFVKDASGINWESGESGEVYCH